MARVRVIVEGQTEERFVSGPLAATLAMNGVFVTPTLVGVPGHRGGNVNYARVKRDIVTALKQDQGVYCTTLLDLYRLGDSFPSLVPGRQLVGQERVRDVEQALHQEVSREVPDLRPDLRFIPYVQIYEFEGLLFSNPAALAEAMFREDLVDQLAQIRAEFATPEDINDGPKTAPSKRLLTLEPRYVKTINGTLAAESIGVQTICTHCPRFRAWYERLAALGVGSL
jgi:hypothetical protein